MREDKKVIVITCNKCGKKIEQQYPRDIKAEKEKFYQGVSWTSRLAEVGVGVPTPDGVADLCKACYLDLLRKHIESVEDE